MLRDIRDSSIGRVAFAKTDPLMIALDRGGEDEFAFGDTDDTRVRSFVSSHLVDHARRTKKRRLARERLFAASVIEPVSSKWITGAGREKERREEEEEAILFSINPESIFLVIVLSYYYY